MLVTYPLAHGSRGTTCTTLILGDLHGSRPLLITIFLCPNFNDLRGPFFFSPQFHPHADGPPSQGVQAGVYEYTDGHPIGRASLHVHEAPQAHQPKSVFLSDMSAV